MADIDLLPQRGIHPLALVDATGVAIGGTTTVAQLAARRMQAVCQVDQTGLALSDGVSTVAQLASRGIRAFAAVDELGVSVDDAVTKADVIRMRGIRPMVAVDANGISQTGSATMLTLAQRGLSPFCPVDETGTAGSLIPVPPNTIRARAGIFAYNGEPMTPTTGYVVTAQAGAFALAGQNATLTPPVSGVSTTFIGASLVALGSVGNSLVIPNVNIGNPSYIATRRVIVVVSGTASAGWNMIGGSIGSATIDQFTDNGHLAVGSDVVEIVSALVTSGTTATVTLNYNGNPTSVQVVAVFIADQSQMTAPTAPVVAMHQDTSGSDINTVTFNTTTKGNGFIVCGVWAGGGAGPTITSSTDPFTTPYSTSSYMIAYANGITATPSYNIQTHAPPAGGNSMFASAAFQ